MTDHSRDLNGLINPAKLADDTVLALSSIERGGKVFPELLKEGIKLCDYLIALHERSKSPEETKGQLTFRTVRDDMKALKESKIDIDRVHKAKEWINGLIENPSSREPEEIRDIQELLITATMSIWQSRTLEFRERKLKRGLIIRG